MPDDSQTSHMNGAEVMTTINISRAAQTIAYALIDGDGGATASIVAGVQTPTAGYFVSLAGAEQIWTLPPERDLHSLLYRYATDHRDLLTQPNHYVGAWVNHDLLHLDVSVHYSERAVAERAGVENRQLAIYDASAGESLYSVAADGSVTGDTYIYWVSERDRDAFLAWPTGPLDNNRRVPFADKRETYAGSTIGLDGTDTVTGERLFTVADDLEPHTYSLAEVRDGTGWPKGALFQVVGDVTATLHDDGEVTLTTALGARTTTFIGDDGTPVVQIDTEPDHGPLRVNVNDDAVFDADPEVGPADPVVATVTESARQRFIDQLKLTHELVGEGDAEIDALTDLAGLAAELLGVTEQA